MPKGQIDFNKVGDLLEDLGNKILKDLQKNIDSKDLIASANLRQSISFDVKIFATKVQLSLSLADYYKFMDKGVKGAKDSSNAPNSPYSYKNKMPPKDAILDYIKTKPLQIKSSVDLTKLNKKGVKVRRRATEEEKRTIEDERNTAAFLIQRKIYNKGLKATNFYSSVVNDSLIDEFSKKLSEAFKQQIIIKLNE